MKKLYIRNEMKKDERIVESITREAFWNLNVPGCDEHYLVHIMRNHKDSMPELNFVAEVDGQVIGNIMYTKATLVDEGSEEKQILTFGPLSILPEYQRKGYGKALLEFSFEKAIKLNYDVIVIFGNPINYVGCDFKSCKKYNVSLYDGVYPCAMLVKELKAGVLENKKWIYHESSVYNIDEQKAHIFDSSFDVKEKKFQRSQETFYILSNSVIN